MKKLLNRLWPYPRTVLFTWGNSKRYGYEVAPFCFKSPDGVTDIFVTYGFSFWYGWLEEEAFVPTDASKIKRLANGKHKPQL